MLVRHSESLEKYIVKRRIISSLLLAMGMTLAAGASAADATGRGSIITEENADGSVVLSNIPSTDNQEAVVAAPDPATTAAGPRGVTPLQATSDPQSAAADGPKDPREQYRDSMMQGAPGTTAGNPAVARRYKMMDRETYRTTVLGATPESPPATSK
jgi:hypothetical protein